MKEYPILLISNAYAVSQLIPFEAEDIPLTSLVREETSPHFQNRTIDDFQVNVAMKVEEGKLYPNYCHIADSSYFTNKTSTAFNHI